MRRAVSPSPAGCICQRSLTHTHTHTHTQSICTPPLPFRPPPQTIMLLLGGFAIAAALSKHAIAKQVGARHAAAAQGGRLGWPPRRK